jgi:hypothetical protein
VSYLTWWRLGRLKEKTQRCTQLHGQLGREKPGLVQKGKFTISRIFQKEKEYKNIIIHKGSTKCCYE